MSQIAKMRQQGFTLLEMLIAVVLVGLVFLAIAPMMNLAFALIHKSNADQEIVNNRKIADSLIEFSSERDGVQRFRLPTPAAKTGTPRLISTIYNPSATTSEAVALQNRLLDSGVTPNGINTDMRAVKNVRVYQLASGLTADVPMFGPQGDKVRLTYDFGVIYSTKCMQSSSCNTSATAANPPGDSPQFTTSNYASWTPAGDDYGVVAFSTLDGQKDMLRSTAATINRLTERFVTDFHNKIRLSSADSTANFFEINTGGLSLANTDPALNFGCRDGWYALSAANVDVLTKLGMNKSEVGITAWGGPISYCRDFDPAGTGSHNSPPHYGALLLNRNMASTAVPTVLSDALIIPF